MADQTAPKHASLEDMTSYEYDVVIVGAGIIGLSIARHFLHHSHLSVAIVDASAPASGASSAGQGYIWMIHKTPGTPMWNLARRSQQLWQMFADNLQDQGINPVEAISWKKTGSLIVGRTEEESEYLKKRVQQLSAAGLKAEYWSSANLLLEEPELAVSPEGCAAFLPDDAQIDVRAAAALIGQENKLFESQNRYAEFYNEPAISLLRSSSKDGKFDAVKTSKNSILYAKKAVVVAAGSWTGSLMQKLTRDSDVLIKVPVQPRKGYLLVIENFKSKLKLNHGTMEAGYINKQTTSPKDSTSTDSVSMTATIDAKGNLLIGSSRQFVGFNTDLDMNIIEQIWERAQEFYPALRKFSLESLSRDMNVRIGLRPYMPDGRPVIGQIPSMPNVFLASGHEGEGISTALGTAELIADMVLGNPFKVDPTPFAVEGRCC